ncbi:hypothetical protein ACFFIF_08165 [Vagococcus entomophilus]|uniref:Holin n=1 Tax=Vagococcus entomophilus TaxID=1160095 RepID=A0A430AH76_9ENTE|nr:hypothetical protein [Vagococcus entomophilus]RSU07265.1 hypothetical protein CBF30_08400 [Vagococcus entomophilus]
MAGVKQVMDITDWAVQREIVFLVLFMLVFAILCFVIYKVAKVLGEEREQSISERKEYLVTLTKQQELIEQQQQILEEEKQTLAGISTTVINVDRKLDNMMEKIQYSKEEKSSF